MSRGGSIFHLHQIASNAQDMFICTENTAILTPQIPEDINGYILPLLRK